MAYYKHVVVGLIVATGLAAGLRAGDPQPPASNQLGPSDEAFLLQARESIGGLTPEWRDDHATNPGAFQKALRNAANERPKPQPQTFPQRAASWPNAQPGPSAWPQPAWHDQPHHPAAPVQARWRTLLDVSCELDRLASDLERQEFWDQADPVRQAAVTLRKQARQLAERGDATHRDPGPQPAE
ncbi:hypothetical protein KOR34_29940 [Posidoniimonas corsicana]|uniref:Uncharacterized protein n=1 Tax=Posidoniimonas corsicana TaxID=1938618 RepID=A0A5C5VHH6_9BACT|nr:hypothetical protein [Posidoniimonas corsicana]TWT38026.1 hypothetical protein KOR34_29940 [Posidoniimonas corsicana]